MKNCSMFCWFVYSSRAPFTNQHYDCFRLLVKPVSWIHSGLNCQLHGQMCFLCIGVDCHGDCTMCDVGNCTLRDGTLCFNGKFNQCKQTLCRRWCGTVDYIECNPCVPQYTPAFHSCVLGQRWCIAFSSVFIPLVYAVFPRQLRLLWHLCIRKVLQGLFYTVLCQDACCTDFECLFAGYSCFVPFPLSEYNGRRGGGGDGLCVGYGDPLQTTTQLFKNWDRFY